MRPTTNELKNLKKSQLVYLLEWALEEAESEAKTPHSTTETRSCFYKYICKTANNFKDENKQGRV